jgi:type IV secretory pathway protease TraF
MSDYSPASFDGRYFEPLSRANPVGKSCRCDPDLEMKG